MHSAKTFVATVEDEVLNVPVFSQRGGSGKCECKYLISCCGMSLNPPVKYHNYQVSVFMIFTFKNMFNSFFLCNLKQVEKLCVIKIKVIFDGS